MIDNVKFLRRAALAAVVIALVVIPSSAQQAPPASQPAAPTTAPNGKNGHVTSQPSGQLLLNFKDATIDSVLDELSAVAGFIVVKIDKPEGRVTLVSKQPVNSSEAISLLNTVLKDAGYAAIQQGRILKILKRDNARYANIPVRVGADPAQVEMNDELITQVIPLKHTDAQQLKTDLQPLIGTQDFTANASSNALVITDTSANIKRIVEIVAALDARMVDAADVKVIPLKYATASTTAKLINDLFGEQSRSRSSSSDQSRFPFFGGGFPGSSSSGGDRGSRSSQQSGQREQVKTIASSEDRTNMLIVAGPTDTLAIVEKVVKDLDANPASEETVFVYRLRNAQALNVEQTINLLFNGTSGTGRTSQTTGSNRLGSSSNRLGSSSSSGSRLGGGSSIGGSGSSSRFGSGLGGTSGLGGSTLGGSSSTGSRYGSSGYSGGGGFFSSMLGGLSQSSMQSAADLSGQVTIIGDPDTNSLLVRTSPKNYERVQLILQELDRSVPQVLIKVLIAEVTHDNSLDVGAEFSVLNLRASGNGQTAGTDFGVTNSTSGVVVQLLETNVTATLRALATANKLDVLSRPYILASDNQLATITVGQQVPIPRNTQVTDTGQTNTAVDYTPVGILLDVIPHINPDGLVIMDVAPTISSLTNRTIDISENFSAPVLDERSAQSRVAVQTGNTIVIGGLMQDKKTASVSKVPILGDIPLLGQLFRRNIDTKTKTELLIFLTPHVAASPNLLPGMSQDEMNGMKLVPNSVDPGTFQDHMKGLQRGGTTQPTLPAEPTTAEPTTAPTE